MMNTMVISDLTERHADLPAQPTDHPLFQDVETLIGRGNWQAAKTLLAQLLTLYPDDAHLQEIAASAHTRSALLESDRETTSASPRASILSRSLKFVVPAVIVILLLSLGTATLLALRLWILPQATAQSQEAQVGQLRQDAQAALTSGDYDRAMDLYRALLNLLPDDREAKEGLEQATQLRATVSLYTEAIAQMEAHHWENALSLLEQIQAQQPGYRDVDQRIIFVQEQQILSTQFTKAETAFKRSDYELAIQEYEALQSRDYGFQRETVQDHLFLSYLQLGLAEEAAAGSDPTQLQAALDNLEKALALRPDDSQTKGESQLLRLYMASLEEYEAENWSQVVSGLTPVYESRPDFADGTVAQHLYEANVAWGDEFLAEGQGEQALVKYQEARLINVPDASGLDQKIAMAEQSLVTPTPSPEPTEVAAAAAPAQAKSAPAPTPTPIPLPYSIKGMSVKSNCGDYGYIHGIVWSAYGLPMEGISVQAFNTTTGLGPLISMPTNQDGIYQIRLEKDQIEGLWTVQVLENGQPASQAWGQRLGGGCVNGVQELKADWQRILETN
jgi:tetratricopeptide (TPR) repeat protein